MAVSTLDPHTPVIVGVGQLTNRVDRGAEVRSPVELMSEAARLAAVDAGVPALLDRLTAVRVVGLLSWRYRDPARLVAASVGATSARTGLTAMGGNAPQALLNTTAAQIQAGELDSALLCGAEAWRTRKSFIRDGTRPDWAVQEEHLEPDERFGAEMTMSHEAETSIGLVAPAQMYALMDHAARIAHGRTIAEQQALIGGLWSRFSAIAAANPHAWRRTERTAAEVNAPGPDNRLVAHPYTKAVNSYEWVDQGAALVVCSVEWAEALGVPRERWVFPVAGADASEPPVSVRRDIGRSVSMRAAGQAVLDAAAVGVDDLGIIDLYSCFPSAVQIAAAELGIGLDRELTVTGGMSFFGGPWNNYVTHSVATTVGRLRSDPSALALCTGNGGHTSKQAFGIYTGQPGRGPFRHEIDGPRTATDRAERRRVVEDFVGVATMEAFTVLHDRAGDPTTALVSALSADGDRAWATTDDETIMLALVRGDLDHAELWVDAGRIDPVG